MLYKGYRCARTLPEALNLLETVAGARPIAGGTDLMVQLGARTIQPGFLVDISRLPELQKIWLQDGQVHIGSAVTHQAVIDSALLQKAAPILVEACLSIGAAQVQHMGTIGGNIANASPAGDLLPPLYALGAAVLIVGPSGERELPIHAFIQGIHKTALSYCELIKEVRFKELSPVEGISFVKFGLRQSQTISVVSAAARLRVEGGVIREASIALGAVAPTVLFARSAEDLLLGQPGSPQLFECAGNAARQDACPIDDIRGSALFRRHLAGPLVQRALTLAWERASKTNPGE